MRQYPVGIQDFKKIRESDKLYIDKTEYVWRMTHGGSDYVFLSRPRRFGKSLLVSTMQCYFEGRRELFGGLAIDKLETEWETYPVLHFDMSKAKKRTRQEVKDDISVQLDVYEDIYGRDERRVTPGQRFEGLIMKAYEQTGKKVVVLVDEYDAPMLEVIQSKQALEEIRDEMRYFYGILKSADEYLRFVFLTGISKFSQLGLFSGLNNIKNISMLADYAAICGITRKELEEQMAEDIDILAAKRGQTSGETLAQLVDHYDGYHFTWPSEDILNPFSLLNAFCDGEIKDYWFETGTSAFTIDLLRKYGVRPSNIGRRQEKEVRFNVPLETSINCVPLLYQSGYLTIKDYDKETKLYTLDIPNNEVRTGLYDELLPGYVADTDMADDTVALVREALAADDIAAALEAIGELLGQIPYASNTAYEGHYQQLMYLLFMQAGADVDAERRTANGNIDIVVRTRTRIFILELKIDKTARAAMTQIERKRYDRIFGKSKVPVVKVGVNIDCKMRAMTG